MQSWACHGMAWHRSTCTQQTPRCRCAREVGDVGRLERSANSSSWHGVESNRSAAPGLHCSATTPFFSLIICGAAAAASWALLRLFKSFVALCRRLPGPGPGSGWWMSSQLCCDLTLQQLLPCVPVPYVLPVVPCWSFIREGNLLCFSQSRVSTLARSVAPGIGTLSTPELAPALENFGRTHSSITNGPVSIFFFF